MKILVIGSGSYVLHDPYGPGVVLRSVLQWCKGVQYEDAITITLTYHSDNSLGEKEKTVAEITSSMKPLSEKVHVKFVHSSKVEAILAGGDIFACFIAVPDTLHSLYASMCIENNCPLWIVKPLTGNLQDAEKLLALSKGRSVQVWADYHKRFDPSNIHLKTKLEQGALGRMLAYTVDYHQPYLLPVEVFDWATDVDVFTYIGCHYVDQVFYLFPDAQVKSVHARPIKGKVFEATGQFDGVLVDAVYDVEGNVLHTPMNVGWFNPKGAPTKSLQTLKVQFEHGLINLDQTRRGFEVWDDTGVAEVNPYFFTEQLGPFGGLEMTGYGYESVKRFLDLVQSGNVWPATSAYPTLNEAIKTERVLYGVQQSLLSGEGYCF